MLPGSIHGGKRIPIAYRGLLRNSHGQEFDLMTHKKKPLPEHAVANGRGIRQLFDHALPRSPAERERFFDETCGGNDALRETLVSLLKAADQNSPLDPEDPDRGSARLFLPRMGLGRFKSGSAPVDLEASIARSGSVTQATQNRCSPPSKFSTDAARR